MEIKILLILLFIHYIGLFVFKSKLNTLSCGIFGWSGKDPKKFNQYKFDMLGVFNTDRGKDSCGVAYDGEIYHGLDKNANFKKFIQHFYIQPTKYPVVIGHTRQASVGAVNKFNIHPFGFGDLNEDYEMYGVHNGTLHNSEDLAKEFNIEANVKYIDDGIEKVRNKIDSEILLEILYKSKNYKVLSKYNGGAAIAWTNLNEPNKLYLFKGASKEYSSSVKEEEERPLFYYKESQNSLYFSSLEEPLWIISEKSKKKPIKRHRHQKMIVDSEPLIGSFDDNTVYIITDGDIDNAEKIKISRAKSQQRKTYTSTYNSAYGDYEDFHDYHPRSTYGYWSTVEDHRTSTQKETLFDKKSYDKVNTQLAIVKDDLSPISLNIYDDTTVHDQNYYKGRIYFNKLRYWKNGHLITGIYTWVNGLGYYYLAEDINTAYATLESLKGRLVVGDDFLSKNDCLEINVDLPEFKHLMPFSKTLVVRDIKNIHYFIAGVKIETMLDYKIALDSYNKWYHSEKKKKLKVSSKNFDYVQLSHISNHPIIDVRYDYMSSDCKTIIHRGIPVKEAKIMPLGSEKIYNIKEGKLLSITKSPYSDSMLFGNPDEKFKKLNDIYDYLIEKDLNLLNDDSKESDEDVIVMENKQLFIERFKEELENIYIIFDDFIQEHDDFVKSNNTDSSIRQIMNQARSFKKFAEVQLSKDNLK